MKSTYGYALAGAIGALALLVGNPAQAYVTHGKWARSAIPVPYYINPEGMPFGIDIVKQSAAYWSTNPQFHFAFSYKGTRSGQGNHTVFMRANLGRGVVGLTWWGYRNGVKSFFRTAMRSDVRWTRQRFLNVCTHELGHAVGLSHTNVRSAVMSSNGRAGYDMVGLHQDDIAGARKLYPPGQGAHPGGSGQLAKPEIVGPQGETATAQPTFSWNPVQSASSYWLSLDRVDANKQQTHVFATRQPITSAQFALDRPLDPGTYYWWVKAKNDGGESEWSWASFTITARQPDPNVGTDPDLGTDPDVGTDPNVGTEPDLGTDPDVGTEPDVGTDPDVEEDPPVRPGVATPLTPSGEVATRQPSFTWRPASHAEEYEVVVHHIDDSNNRVEVLRARGVRGTRLVSSSQLEPEKAYYWWIRASNDVGQGDWSDHGRFTIAKDAQVPAEDLKPGTPELIAPQGEGESLTPTFSWKAAEQARGYELALHQVDADGNRSELLRIDMVEDTRYVSVSPLERNTTYYWWVRASNVAGKKGEWSEVGTFSVTEDELEPPAVANLEVPVLTFPIVRTEQVKPTFTWGKVEGATHYELRADVAGGAMVLHEQNIPQASFTPPAELEAGKTYHWWVRPWKGSVPGEWGSAAFALTKKQNGLTDALGD